MSLPSDWELSKKHASPSVVGTEGSGQGSDLECPPLTKQPQFLLYPSVHSHCCISGDRYRLLPSYPASEYLACHTQFPGPYLSPACFPPLVRS